MLHLRADFYGIKLRTDLLNLDWKSREGVTHALKIRGEWLVQGGVRRWASVGLARKYRIFGWVGVQWELGEAMHAYLSCRVKDGGCQDLPPFRFFR